MAMAVYTQLTQAQLEAIIAAYGLGHLVDAQGITEGVENSNFLLKTSPPDAAYPITRSILTVFEKRVSAADLPFYLALMQHLHAKGVACPQPLTQENGAMLYEVAGKQAAIVTFLEGQSLTQWGADEMRQVGETLARMHLATQDFPLRRANDLSVAGWQALLARIADQLERIEPGLRELVETELQTLSEAWPHDLPAGIIHADFFPNNVFFQGGALSGVIDFYFACHDAYAYELAICLNCWCFDESGAFRADCSRAMLAGYESLRPLEPAEKQALPLLARGAALRFLLTRAHDWLHHDESAQVVPHDPLEYARYLRWHQGVVDHQEYENA